MNKNVMYDNLLKYIREDTDNDNTFLYLFKSVFSITETCYILKINRNRYNYLSRTNDLNNRILKLRKEK